MKRLFGRSTDHVRDHDHAVERGKRNGTDDAMRDIRAVHNVLKNKTVVRWQSAQMSIDNVSASLLEDLAKGHAYAEVMADAMQRLQPLIANQLRDVEDITDTLTFNLSTVFTRRVVHFLAGHPQHHERMVIGTGVINNNTVVPLEALKIPTSLQSLTQVVAHPGFLAATIHQLQEDGHNLWFMWHSHPTKGRNGTQPSGTDLAHQKRLADFGMPHVIGGICNRDGWLRLFNPTQDFAVSLFGSDGVEVVSDTPREKILKVNIEDGTNALLAI